jgi:hypothetical protein
MNSKINKITNVFQSVYCDDYIGQGFGDFLRGSYSILQFCRKYGIECEISIKNSTLSKYFKNNLDANYIPICDLNVISTIQVNENNNGNCGVTVRDENELNVNVNSDFVIRNHNEHINYIINRHNLGNNYIENLDLFTNQFPMEELCEEDKKYIQRIFEPTDEMKFYFLEELGKLQLNVGLYNVIHVRCGDSILIEGNSIEENWASNIINNSHIQRLASANEKCLVISDSNELKQYLTSIFPNFKCKLDSNIQHIAVSTVDDIHAITDMILDYNFIINSKAIFSFTNLGHGTGFSEWPARTYNIPYKCFYHYHK